MFGKHNAEDAQVDGHSVTDILCADRASARNEAARRQLTETEGAEWIYLRRDRDKQWIARRWTVGDSPEPKRSKSRTAREVIAGLLNPLNR